MSKDEELVPVFIPSLAAILVALEREKGVPLSESEVLAARDGATVMMVPAGVVASLDEDRGYRDLAPADCWLEWRALRLELADSDSEPPRS